MKINFTKKQMKDLLTIAEAGIWVINSYRDEPLEEYEDLYQYIIDAAHEMKIPEVVFDKEFNRSFLTVEAEEDVQKFIHAYDDYTFWEELAYNMAKRDYAQEINVRNDTHEQSLQRIAEIAEKYMKEFTENGLKNLTLK